MIIIIMIMMMVVPVLMMMMMMLLMMMMMMMIPFLHFTVPANAMISLVAPAALKPCDQHVAALRASPIFSPPLPSFFTTGPGNSLVGLSTP